MKTGHKQVVFLVTKNKIPGRGAIGLLREHHGRNIKINVVYSPKMFRTPHDTDAPIRAKMFGLDTLIRANSNSGMVYVIEQDVPRECINFAAEHGGTFGVISKSSPSSKTEVAWCNYHGKAIYRLIDLKLSVAG